MNITSERKKGRPGAKHFRTEVKHTRQKGYTLNVAIGELLDYPILNATIIDITIKFKPTTDNKKILQIQIRDNTLTGFQNLSENNDKNPFNFGHISSSHDDDQSISEFGAGTKEAFIALSDKTTIYTKSDGQYFKIVFNIEKMSNVEDVNESFDYDEKIITQEEYEEEHKLSCGSSIILEEIVDGIIVDLAALKQCIITTYGKVIKERNIVVKFNDEQLIDNKTSPFNNIYCEPFNSITKIYVMKNETTNNEEYYMVYNTDKTRYYLYKDEPKKWSPEITTKRDTNKLLTHINLDPECLIMTLKGTERQFCKEDDKNAVSGGDIKFYKRGRQHGSYNASMNNGTGNHIFLELEIYSKKIGKELGMTVNKLIKLDKENKLCNVIKATIGHLQSKHAYDAGNNTAVNKYNIIKDTGLNISHVKIPTKLQEKLDIEAEKKRLAEAEKERLAHAKRLEAAIKIQKTHRAKIACKLLKQKAEADKEKLEKAKEDKARLEKEKLAKAEADKLASARLEKEKLAAIKIQKTHRAKLACKSLKQKAEADKEKLEKAKEDKARLEKEKLAKAEEEKLASVRLEKEKLAAIKIQRKHRENLGCKSLKQKAETKRKTEPILVDSYRKGSVEGKKFKEVINYYINQVGDNEDVCGEDLAMYNKVCKKLNIIP